MKNILLRLFLLLYFSINLSANTITLTKEEKEFISSTPQVTIAMMPNFIPFTYAVGDKVVGFEHDLLKLITAKTGLEFKKTIGNWTTIYNAFKAKEVDMISSISYKKEREPFTSFTSSYYEVPIMVFVRDDFGEYNGLKSLKNKKVGIVKDVFYSKDLEEIGTMDLIYFKSKEDLLKALVIGKIDALVQNLTNITYLIKKNVYTNIKLADELTLPNLAKEDLHFGVQLEKPIIASIFQKGLNTITQEEKEDLANKWIGAPKQYGSSHIELDEIETAYLDMKVIKYCIDPNWMPFESFSENGEHIGMSADYVNLFKKMIPTKFEVVKTTSWNHSFEFIQQHKCDMLTLTMNTPKNNKYLNFTSPYLEIPLVVATKLDVPFIDTLIDLKDKKIGVLKGYTSISDLKNKYPSLDFVEVENTDNGLNKVSQGKFFAYIGTLASIGYKFQTKYYGELKIAGKLSESWKLGIGVRKDDKILLGILEKIVNNITKEHHRDILNKWVSIKYEKGIDYSLVWKVATVLIFLLLLVVYWNRKIAKAQIEIEKKNKELEKLATIDKLTNIYNRAKLEELLQIEIDRSDRLNHIFGVVILDIDYFKDVNDQYGHQVGDDVLIEISNLLKRNTRKIDYVFRYGGEEFIIICPESLQDDVVNFTEALRLRIAKFDFPNVGKKTASFGIAMYQKGDTIDSIIKRADDALYTAKNGGRNRVVLS